MVEGESNFWKKNDFEEKHSGFNKNKILNKERRPLSKIEDWKRETLELNLSTLLRVRKDEEDER